MQHMIRSYNEDKIKIHCETKEEKDIYEIAICDSILTNIEGSMNIHDQVTWKAVLEYRAKLLKKYPQYIEPE